MAVTYNESTSSVYIDHEGERFVLAYNNGGISTDIGINVSQVGAPYDPDSSDDWYLSRIADPEKFMDALKANQVEIVEHLSKAHAHNIENAHTFGEMDYDSLTEVRSSFSQDASDSPARSAVQALSAAGFYAGLAEIGTETTPTRGGGEKVLKGNIHPDDVQRFVNEFFEADQQHHAQVLAETGFMDEISEPVTASSAAMESGALDYSEALDILENPEVNEELEPAPAWLEEAAAKAVETAMAKVEGTDAAPAPAETPAPAQENQASAPDFETTLRLQNALLKADPSYEEGMKWTDAQGIEYPANDGDFGSRTRAATQDYAAKNGLDPNDIEAVIAHAEAHPAPDVAPGAALAGGPAQKPVEMGEMSYSEEFNEKADPDYADLRWKTEHTNESARTGPHNKHARTQSAQEHTDGIEFEAGKRRTFGAEAKVDSEFRARHVDGDGHFKSPEDRAALEAGILTIDKGERLDLTRLNPENNTIERYQVGEFASNADNLQGRNWGAIPVELSDDQQNRLQNAFAGLSEAADKTGFDAGKGMIVHTKEGAEIMLGLDENGAVAARLVDDPQSPQAIAARGNTPPQVANMDWNAMKSPSEIQEKVAGWQVKEDQPAFAEPPQALDEAGIGVVTPPAGAQGAPKVG